MMYIPLNAVIVALIFQDSYDTDALFPTTMTQLFDALTRALLRRHLVVPHIRFPSEYCMPPSLQCMEDISKLPPLVAKQLLQLARVAYESLCKKRYVFTDLGEDFEHLGTMKKEYKCECVYRSWVLLLLPPSHSSRILDCPSYCYFESY